MSVSKPPEGHQHHQSPPTGALDAISSWPVGTAAAVVVHGDAVVDHFGAITDVFALASITKLLTAVTVLVATEEESVNLDDEVHGAPKGALLRDLLDHSSGLAPDEPKALSQVGQRRIYSNMGYELAARHVATQTGIDFATYLHEAVCLPAGMTRTVLEGSPAYGASSSAQDLAAFVIALRSHRILSAHGVSQLSTPSRPTVSGVLPGYGRHDPNPWGLGAEVRGHKSPHWTSPQNHETTWGHFGRAGTFLWVDPSRDLAAICLTDTTFGEWAIERWPQLSTRILNR